MDVSVIDKIHQSVELPEIEDTYNGPAIETCRTNIVSGKALRRVQRKTLDKVAESLTYTFGPMGSNTKIVTGNDEASILSEYSKDGHKVLKHIKFSNPIEMSIKSELVDITHHVEQKVGDGTTSAIILSDKVFNYLETLMETTYTDVQPYEVIFTFKEIVKEIKDQILINKKEMTLDDIYDLCMISTNGNEEISRNIEKIYRDHGLDVSMDVSISPTDQSMVKTYDGLTLSEGYSDPVYINNTSDGTCEIHNASIYAFKDPIDTSDLISLFEKIIMSNIIEPLQDGSDCVPTVIVSPKMSRDMSAMLGQVVEVMHSCADNQKPPLLVITDLGASDEGIYLDIAKLCGCKYIEKYIDPEIKKINEEKGLAANLENVVSFAGKCELVVADVGKTKFVNPADMMVTNEDGEEVYSDTYNSLINFLSAELAHARENGEDSRSVGFMRKRLKSLQSNMVEYFVGGISIADRDSTKDLVEDAVKNCASACENGYGRASNFEGLCASIQVAQDYIHNDTKSLKTSIAVAIFSAYIDTIKALYMTTMSESDAEDVLDVSVTKDMPYNLRTGEYSNDVKSSIMTDVEILDAISKIITIMVTSNQCLLQAPQLNTYTE